MAGSFSDGRSTFFPFVPGSALVGLLHGCFRIPLGVLFRGVLTIVGTSVLRYFSNG